MSLLKVTWSVWRKQLPLTVNILWSKMFIVIYKLVCTKQLPVFIGHFYFLLIDSLWEGWLYIVA